MYNIWVELLVEASLLFFRHRPACRQADLLFFTADCTDYMD